MGTFCGNYKYNLARPLRCGALNTHDSEGCKHSSNAQEELQADFFITKISNYQQMDRKHSYPFWLK